MTSMAQNDRAQCPFTDLRPAVHHLHRARVCKLARVKCVFKHQD